MKKLIVLLLAILVLGIGNVFAQGTAQEAMNKGK